MLSMNQNLNNKTQGGNRKPAAKKPASNSAFTENWVRVKSIKNGIIKVLSSQIST